LAQAILAQAKFKLASTSLSSSEIIPEACIAQDR